MILITETLTNGTLRLT